MAYSKWLVINYAIGCFIEVTLSVFGLLSIVTIYNLYKNTLLFYFLLYDIIVSLFSIFHFIKVYKDMLNEEIKDIVYVKLKTFLMMTSFIWGIVILQEQNTIIYFQDNYPQAYVSFINYFIFSSFFVLQTIYKILHFIYNKHIIAKHNDIDSEQEFLIKIDKEFGETYEL